MKRYLIYNPAAGRAIANHDFLSQHAREFRCDLKPALSPQDTGRIAREAVRRGVDRIIVAGGDGTISQVVNAIAPAFDQIELAVLPLGTGNDLARSLGIQQLQMEDAFQIAVGDHVKKIDLVQVSGDEPFWCVNVANGGFGGHVAQDMQADEKQKWGSFAYWIRSVAQLADLHQYHVTLTMDDQFSSQSTLGVAVANGRFVGGGFPVAPEAMLNDGLLDVTLIPDLPIMELISVAFQFAIGDEESVRAHVKSYRVRKIRIESSPDMLFSVDGDPVKRFDTTFETIPQQVSIACCRDAPGLKEVPSIVTKEEMKRQIRGRAEVSE